MRVRTQRRIGGALVAVMVVMFAVMVVLFVRLPEGSARQGGGGGSTVRVTERAAPVEGAFCGLLAAGLTDQRFGTALSQSAELQHRTLGALAGRWGQDGSEGARAQVLLECRRLGLIP
jgi:hypothetical protein